jgi:ZIP family zinc transporter
MWLLLSGLSANEYDRILGTNVCLHSHYLMSVVAAVGWGAATSASLWLGQLFARPLTRAPRVTGLIMGFGAGSLFSAVAYQLVPAESLGDGFDVAVGLSVGALVYFAADQLLDRRGAGMRHEIRPPEGSGSGPAMFLGALLDGLPESFVLGIGIAVGGSVSVAFVVAVLVSNVPQGVAGTTSLIAAGRTQGQVFWLWAGLTAVCGIASGIGFVAGAHVPRHGLVAEAFAAGAVLMVLADSMIPEAYRHGGRAVGLATVAGFLVTTGLALAQ